MRMMCPTIGRGGGTSDSETPAFFGFVGVDLQARWEINKVCTGDWANNKIKIKTNLPLGRGYTDIQTDLCDLTPPVFHPRFRV